MRHLKSPTESNQWGVKMWCGAWQSLNTRNGLPRSRFDLSWTEDRETATCPRCLDQEQRSAIIREAMKLTPDGIVIYCGRCRTAHPFMDFCTSPVNGQLPPGQYRCPTCYTMFRQGGHQPAITQGVL